MEDLTTENKTPTAVAINPDAAKQTGWLTKNRFWNLVFLFLVPAEIYLAALMWNAWMLILPIATTIAIFNFVSVDTSAIDNKTPQAVKAIKSAAYIWFFSVIAFGFAASKILSLIGMQLGQFGFGEVVFFIFLIPISILCYANIPLASCFEASSHSKMSNSGLTSSYVSSLSRHQNDTHRRLTSDPSYRNLSGNIYHR